MVHLKKTLKCPLKIFEFSVQMSIAQAKQSPEGTVLSGSTLVAILSTLFCRINALKQLFIFFGFGGGGGGGVVKVNISFCMYRVFRQPGHSLRYLDALF